MTTAILQSISTGHFPFTFMLQFFKLHYNVGSECREEIIQMIMSLTFLANVHMYFIQGGNKPVAHFYIQLCLSI